MTVRIFNQSLYTMLLLLISKSVMASTFSITPYPGTALPTSILKGQTAMAYYLVQNNTSVSQKNIFVRLPPNVTQVINKAAFLFTCKDSFELPKNTSAGFCILQLKITGPVDSNDPDPTHHLAICQSDFDCSSVDDKKNELHVIEGKANVLTRVAIVNEFTGTPNAIGLRNTAYTSTDGGVSWTPNKIEEPKSLIRAMSCEGNHGLSCNAVGDVPSGPNGITTLMAYNSFDGGFTWTSHTLDTFGFPTGLSGVTCSDDGEYCIAVGVSTPLVKGWWRPTVYTTSNGGNSWALSYLKAYGIYGSTLRAISCNGSYIQYCTAVGEFGSGFENGSNTTTFVAYTSNDGGVNWVSHIIEKHRGISLLKALTCNNNGRNCIAVGYIGGHDNIRDQAIISRSNDGGYSWSSYIPNQNNDGGLLNDITCNNSSCIAVGSVSSVSENHGNYHPVIYISQDEGLNWVAAQNIQIQQSELNGGTHFYFKSGSFNSITCDHAGQYCTIIGYAYYHVDQFHGQTNGYVNLPIIFRTTDGGKSWSRRWPDFANTDGLISGAIANTGIGISGNNE